MGSVPALGRLLAWPALTDWLRPWEVVILDASTGLPVTMLRMRRRIRLPSSLSRV